MLAMCLCKNMVLNNRHVCIVFLQNLPIAIPELPIVYIGFTIMKIERTTYEWNTTGIGKCHRYRNTIGINDRNFLKSSQNNRFDIFTYSIKFLPNHALIAILKLPNWTSEVTNFSKRCFWLAGNHITSQNWHIQFFFNRKPVTFIEIPFRKNLEVTIAAPSTLR